MKRNSQPSFFFLANPLKAMQQEPSTPPAQNQTPYLKAILSGTSKLSTHEDDLPAANPDRAAALRYIKESGLLKK